MLLFAVKYDHRQKAQFDFYIYDILINLASILFPEHQNYKTCTGQARPPAKQSEADGRNQEIFATRHKDTKYFVLLFFLSVLVPWWREEKSFATKKSH